MGGMELPAGLAWSLVHIIPLSLIYFALRTLPTLLQWLILQYRARVVPEPEPSHWLLGHSKQIGDRKNLRTIRQKWIETNPRLYRTKITFLFQSVNLIHAETVVGVLRSSAPKHNYFYGFLKPWLGEGLLVSNGQKWARDRRLLTHCFHFDILRDYVEVYTDACGIMLQKWSESCARGESVDVTVSCTMLTLDVILRCAMGFESDCQMEDGKSSGGNTLASRYAKAVVYIANAILQRQSNLLHHSDFLFSLTSEGRKLTQELKVSKEMSQHLIQERKAALQESGGKSAAECRDFLDVLLTVEDEDGNGLTDEEVREQVDTFLFRGHDTTASALQWALYHLAQHPEFQEKCRSEVKAVVLDGKDVSSGTCVTACISHEHLGKLKYLTQCLKESMRISTPVPFIGRETQEDVTINNMFIPCGATADLSLLDIHMCEEHWPEPLKFDPERFSPDQSQGRHPYSYVPFSAGPRNCIGQSMAMDELKTSLAMVLMHYRLAVDPLIPTPKWSPAMIARPVPNIHLLVEEV
eukprot:scpid49322/ scgid2474/ Leukotriene-B(4) omega-hydroxylase 1; CYPIVF2; Cytochrome P450 4F2; Cytochrome P450-LTB-omega; Leukotriene-B(4) 20-monooxygenase 1